MAKTRWCRNDDRIRQNFESVFDIHSFFYKNLVYKNIKVSKCPKIKNVVDILLVAVSNSEMTFL